MDPLDILLLGLLATFIGVMAWKGDEIITAIQWRLSKSGREARHARQILSKFYAILHLHAYRDSSNSDQELANYLRSQGVVAGAGVLEKFDSEHLALIDALEKKAQVVSLQRLERATHQSADEMRTQMDIWYNEGMLPCWAIVYFKEDVGPLRFRESLAWHLAHQS